MMIHWRRCTNRVLWLLLFGLLLVRGRPAGAQSGFFVDVTEQAGLDFQRRGVREKAIGQAWGDYDQDGWLDLYVTDAAGPNALFHNQGDGTFRRSPYDGLVALPQALSGGAIFADYDNDGWPDLLVLNWGENALFRNDAGRGFIDVTAAAGVGGGGANSKTAAWGDYDQDGRLDLYVANWACYPRCGRPLQGEKDRLYHNNGDGTFSDVTDLLGARTVGAGFVASFTDYDNDGDLDIYLVNDEFINPIGNVLWRNDGAGCDGWCFSDVSAAAGANTRLMGMGLATADFDRDGDQDFYFSNAGPMALLQNQGNGTFTDIAARAGVQERTGIGWGAVFIDYDNNGWLDLYLAIMEGVQGRGAANPLFRNNGDGSFTNLGAASGAADTGASLGVAYADYDNDGWLDLVVGNYDGGYRLYRNDGARFSGAHWLAVDLVGDGPINRDAVGARVFVRHGDQSQFQEVICGGSLGAGNSLALHFGLGLSTWVDELRVVWPDGREQTFRQLPADTRYRIRYGQNRPLTGALRVTGLGPGLALAFLGGGVLLILALAMPLAWLTQSGRPPAPSAPAD